MKSKFGLLLTIVACTGLTALPGRAQFPPSERCLSEAESCAYQDYPQVNPQVNFRTPQQIQQRQLNSIENQCGASDSTACNNLVPEVQTRQESPVMQQLRESQIDTVESAPSN